MPLGGTAADDLFPETLAGAPQIERTFEGELRDEWGFPRVAMRLVGLWSAADAGWRVGWLVQLDKAVDEWHPAAETKHRGMDRYPWYRLDELPRSGRFDVAAAIAARAAKIVLAQMHEHAEDEAGVRDALAVSERVEAQARAWLDGS